MRNRLETEAETEARDTGTGLETGPYPTGQGWPYHTGQGWPYHTGQAPRAYPTAGHPGIPYGWVHRLPYSPGYAGLPYSSGYAGLPVTPGLRPLVTPGLRPLVTPWR